VRNGRVISGRLDAGPEESIKSRRGAERVGCRIGRVTQRFVVLLLAYALAAVLGTCTWHASSHHGDSPSKSRTLRGR
jgi:hypothetical protein